jgi:glycosyltransferase involved in cell wall biosynthesis
MLGREMKMKVSIITPCFNEELSIKLCIRSVRELMRQLDSYDYEHIIADNASQDRTVFIVKEEMKLDSKIKLIINSRNVGPFRNMWNALKSTTGDVVVPFLPADLQDPVDVIPKFLMHHANGALVVYGIRENRQEGFLLKNSRKLYYRIIKRFSDADIPINAGEFLLVDRIVLQSVLKVDDEYPYIRGLIAQTGVPYKTVSYNWDVRRYGKSRNSFINLIDQAINGFVSTNRVTGRLVLLSGFFISFVSLSTAFIMTLSFLFLAPEVEKGIPLLLVSMFFMGGIQIFFLGILGEYIMSTHTQVRKSPPMFEIERLNFNENHEK